MALTPPMVINWVVDTSASNHTTSNAGNLTTVCPPNSIDLSSIIGGNKTTLSITSVGDTTLLGPFYLNNNLVAPDII
jgi:hypothetical protein